MSRASQPYFCRLSDLTPEAIDWIWPGYLAAGKLTLIDGDPDQGKSLVTLDLAARLTTGRPLPDGYVPPGPRSVVLLGGEDSIKDTVIPRLRAAGADTSRIHVVGVEPPDGGPARSASLPEDCDLLRDVLRDTASRLLVADPLFAFLGRGFSPINDALVRSALTPLARVAEETRSAMMLSRHLTKGAGKRALYRGSGSIALIGQARAAFLVARAPDDPDLHVLACTKSNLAKPPPALGYRIRRNPDDQAVLEWTGPVPISADELILGPHRAKGEATALAVAFLQQLLQAGPVESEVVYRKARSDGIADRTLNRAKVALGIESEQDWCDGGNVWRWKLPTAATPLSPEEAYRQFMDDYRKGEEQAATRQRE